MNKYEGIYILKDNLSEEEKTETIEKLKKCVGKVESFEDLGVKKLAYEIRGNKTGYYIKMEYISENCYEIEKQARLDDNVIKFINVLLEHNVDCKYSRVMEIMKILKDIEVKFEYRELETAFYIYARYGENNYTEEQMKEIDEILINSKGSIFDEVINELTEKIIGG